MRRGVVYACSHSAWLRETIDSAMSCRRHMPTLIRQIYVTRPFFEEHKNLLQQNFDQVVALDELAYRDRPRFESALQTDLDQAIFIDSDTLILMPFGEVFDLLEHFDLAVTSAPYPTYAEGSRRGIYDAMPKVSEALCEWNPGFLVARIDDGFRNLVRRWMELFGICLTRGYKLDQAAFRIALATSRLRPANLPENYNFRANIPRFVVGPVKVLHAHGVLQKIASYINNDQGMRFYVPKPGEIQKTGSAGAAAPQ